VTVSQDRCRIERHFAECIEHRSKNEYLTVGDIVGVKGGKTGQEI
jgi:hypothetical protein